MNIVTIASSGWIRGHLKRWIRMARKNCPGAKLYGLIPDMRVEGEDRKIIETLDGFKMFGKDNANRPWYNLVRMSATKILGLEEVLYCDCDADVAEDLGGIEKENDKKLGCVKSPAMHEEWVALAEKLGWGYAKEEMNNGLLYMRGDCEEPYLKAREEVDKIGVEPRIAGTLVFNVMLRRNPEMWGELPYKYSVIFWDLLHLPNAKIIQYCNDRGQSKRLRLEALYEAAQ
jgi:hypothetical protein